MIHKQPRGISIDRIFFPSMKSSLKELFKERRWSFQNQGNCNSLKISYVLPTHEENMRRLRIGHRPPTKRKRSTSAKHGKTCNNRQTRKIMQPEPSVGKRAYVKLRLVSILHLIGQQNNKFVVIG